MDWIGFFKITMLIIFALALMISPAFFGAILPNILENRKSTKQRKCFHLWRKLDAAYESHGAIYRYRCEKCGLEKFLSERQSKLFEKDFMSDWE